jgi:hypothetical protein
LLGLGWQTLQRLEHNLHPPRPKTREKIVDFLGYDPEAETQNPARD